MEEEGEDEGKTFWWCRSGWREKKEHRKGDPSEKLAPRRFWSMTIQLRICSRISSWDPSLCVFSDGSLFTWDLLFCWGVFFFFGRLRGRGARNTTRQNGRQKSPASPKSLVSVAREQRPPGGLRVRPGTDRGLVLFPASCVGTTTVHSEIGFQSELKIRNIPTTNVQNMLGSGIVDEAKTQLRNPKARKRCWTTASVRL